MICLTGCRDLSDPLNLMRELNDRLNRMHGINWTTHSSTTDSPWIHEQRCKMKRSSHLICMSQKFDPEDYSFAVKMRGSPPKPWRWEIYRAGSPAPVRRSPVLFESMAEAAKEGKRALNELLAQRAAEGASL
jgi:hypothetical protein